MEQNENKTMKKTINRTGWMLFTYYAVFFVTVLIVTIFQMAILMVSNPRATEQQMFDMISASGTSSIFGLLLGFIVIFLFRGKQLFSYDMVHENKPLPQKVFFRLLCIFLGSQLLFSIINVFLENIFNLFGYTLQMQIASATGSSNTVSMFLYAAIGAPIFEEVVFRGAVLRSLEKFGKPFAMIVSSVLFGIYHGNLPQGIFAFCVGMVLSYTAIEYSFKWAVALHMINNLVMGNVLSMVLSPFSLEVQTLVTLGILVFFFVMAIYYLWRYRSEIREFFKTQPAEPKSYRLVLTSVGMILFTLVNLYMMISTITPL